MKHEGPSVSRQRLAPDWLLVFAKFLRHGKEIATFVPSSPYLSRALVEQTDYDACRWIVELGAGTGPITAELLERVKAPCRALIIERDPDFCVRLRERFPAEAFPQAEIIQADAADLDRLLSERGIERVDHFFCGLPLPSFPQALRDRVLEVVQRRLAEGGTFRQLTNMPWVYYRLYRRYFAGVHFRFVVRNFPPGGFYTCRRPLPGLPTSGPALGA